MINIKLSIVTQYTNKSRYCQIFFELFFKLNVKYTINKGSKTHRNPAGIDLVYSIRSISHPSY
jgi:hypothetical protein